MRTTIIGVALVAAAATSGFSWADNGPEGVNPVRPSPAEIAPNSSHALATAVVSTGQKLVAVGARGHILMSGDGMSWKQANSPVRSLLTSVFFVGDRFGWAVGHDAVILHTSDGGESWTLQNFAPALNQPLLDVLFLDRDRGFAIGAYGLFLQTSDGGKTWLKMENDISAETRHLNAMCRLDNDALLVVGEEGMLAMSTDEGATWKRLQSPYSSSLFSVAPKGGQGAVVGGLRGSLFETGDLAVGQWQRLESRSKQSVFGLSRLGNGDFMGVGANGTFLRIHNDSVKAIDLSVVANDGGRLPSQKGAVSDVIAWNDGVVTAGDDGLIFIPTRSLQ